MAASILVEQFDQKHIFFFPFLYDQNLIADRRLVRMLHNQLKYSFGNWQYSEGLKMMMKEHLVLSIDGLLLLDTL
jgi:hypothetical protein